MTLINRHIRLAVITAFALLLASHSFAYSVSPLRTELTPIGKGSTQRITITNTESKPITLALNPERITTDSEGKVSREPAADDIQVFPPQVILAPGKRQMIQIRYTGDANTLSSLYTIHVSQVPILATEGAAQIKVAMDFHVAVLVQPDDGAPQLSVENIIQDETNSGWKVNVVNRGNAAGRFNWGEWSAQTDSGKVNIPHNDLEIGESGYILPGDSRWITLPPSQSQTFSQIHSITFTPNTALASQ
ncbi:molecular chaperone [Gilvimarinus sp. DA14]|uniref:fimbrial biogenesis chaperone n=1 Tax=Gilvimarinus sp. DA14 TaxID=2956798 RepID=UPI0020B8D7E7|nr:fimbria/pilus periplasmic chaperone [Gilvimarinus sp. DA14]UTF60849.1 fimbria/pilus periplasmic chaperone [Gilvimarinus sp. DA14]